MRPLTILEEIDQFALARRIPRAAITEDVLRGVRNLDERNEVEPFVRAIIADSTDTPHGSTEIADILTTHVTRLGTPRFAAFLNKGKATQKVTSREIGHQILKLRQVPNLGLAVLLAVGDIHDDAKRDFIQTAQDNIADFLIIDATDVARLFIAYQKICPMDGHAFVQDSCPVCHHKADEPVELTIKVQEELRYSELSLKDVSHALAKRYRADILTDPHYSRATLREVVKKATWEFRKSRYYRSERLEARFGDQDADSVAMFVYVDVGDLQTVNWVCRTQWVHPRLPKEDAPMPFGAGERLGDIEIDWNADHEARRHLFEREGKQDWIRRVLSLIPDMERLIARAKESLRAYAEGDLTNRAFEEKMQALEGEALDLSHRGGSDKVPPVECAECDQALAGALTLLHNTFIPFAAWGRAGWDWDQKLRMSRE